MLEIRPNCEHCNKELKNTATDVMICSFECTYCRKCALEIFQNVCPSCGGNFEKRPIRPSKHIQKFPASQKNIFDEKDLGKAEKLIKRYKNVLPQDR